MIMELGLVQTTPGAREALEEAGQQPEELLLRHGNGDWGELGTTTWPDRELKEGFRIFSAYTLATGVKVCIFTEEDRSLTRILLPEEV